MDDQAIALIRTSVPVLVGSLLAALARWVAVRYGYTIDVTGATAFVAPVAITAFTTLYYAAARGLKDKVPGGQYLLGHPATPSYGVAAPAAPASAAVVPAGDVAVGVDSATPQN